MVCPLGVGSNNLPQVCSGRGRCMSLAQINSNPDYKFYNSKIGYKTNTSWDADMIYGCVCDSKYEGVDCSVRSCLRGDDVLTAGVDERQVFDCTAAAGTSSGGIQFIFKNKKTNVIPYDATANLIELYLEQLTPTIEDVTVTINAGTTLCSVGGSTTSIVFHIPQGPQYNTPLVPLAVNGLVATTRVFVYGTASILNPSVVSITGTKEYAVCSNHGICDTNPILGSTASKTGTGTCICEGGWSSSNGKGSTGNRNDCGYNANGPILYNNIDNLPTKTTICPVRNSKTCNGKGYCSNDTNGKCICNAGYSKLFFFFF